MAVRLVIDPNELARLKQKLTRLQEKGIMQAALIVGAETLRRIMQEYPPESHRPQAFKTDKSRRYFFWALRKGKIEVPYRRGQSPGSESLKHRWTVTPVSDGVEVRNNASYVRYVHSWESQAAYHKETGWKTDRQVITEDREKIVNDISSAWIIAANHIWNEE